MQSLDSSALIGLGVFAFIVIIFVLFFLASTKAKKALTEFAASRGLMVMPKDEGDELRRRLVERFGMPEGGIYRDILQLPLSYGEGWLFTKTPDTTRRSSDRRASSGSSQQYIIVFIDIPITGRTFAARAVPIAGALGKQMVEFLLAKAFGAKGIHHLDVTAERPDLAKVYNIFTEDEQGARSVILSSGVVSCLMTHPGKEPVNISFTPKGFGLEIESMLKSREIIEQFVQWTDEMARVLGDR